MAGFNSNSGADRKTSQDISMYAGKITTAVYMVTDQLKNARSASYGFSNVENPDSKTPAPNSPKG